MPRWGDLISDLPNEVRKHDAQEKSRDEIFCLLFFLLCCRQFYLLPVVKTKNVLLGSFFFLLALLAKEGAIIFLPVIFLIDYQKEKNILSL